MPLQPRILEKFKQIEILLQSENLGSRKRARKMAEEWLQLNPLRWEPHFYMGTIEFLEHNYEKAAVFYAKAKKHAPSEAVVWLNNSAVLSHQRDFEAAIHEANHAITLGLNHPRKMQGLRVIGRSLLELRRWEEAERIFERLKDNGASDPAALILRVLTGSLSAIFDDVAPPQTPFFSEDDTLGTVSHPKETILGRMKPFFLYLHKWLTEGREPEEILEVIDEPDSSLTPKSEEYVEWWCSLVSDPSWGPDCEATLDLLRVPGMREKLTEGRFGDADALLDLSAEGW